MTPQPAVKPFVLGREGGGHGFAFGDVNGDGREDVLCEIGWYERPEGDPFATLVEVPSETDLDTLPHQLPVCGEGSQRGRPARYHLRPRPRIWPLLVGAARTKGGRHDPMADSM